MRIIVRPSGAPNLHIDVTKAVTSAIAHELARLQEGNDMLNWLEAERLLDQLLSRRAVTEAGPLTPAGNAVVADLPELRAQRARRSSRLAASSLPGSSDGFAGPRATHATRAPATPPG